MTASDELILAWERLLLRRTWPMAVAPALFLPFCPAADCWANYADKQPWMEAIARELLSERLAKDEKGRREQRQPGGRVERTISTL